MGNGDSKLIEHPERIGRIADPLLEQARKMLGIFKTQIIGNLTYGFIGAKDFFFGHIDKLA